MTYHAENHVTLPTVPDSIIDNFVVVDGLVPACFLHILQTLLESPHVDQG